MKELIAKLLSYSPQADSSLVERAYQVAAEAHAGKKRLSGEAYLTHPLAVANILTDLEQDPVTLAAALLHDVVEDSGLTKETIAAQFGGEIAKLVEGVTKLGQLSFVSREERQAENFRKMFVAMGEDFRIIIIKLADRLHNMQTLQYLPPERQKETALETREIFAPLAHRMGMWRLKWLLEDLAFLYLEPEEYDRIRNKVAESRGSRESYIEEFMVKLKELITAAQIPAEVNGRAKHFYSIYCKMRDQHLEFSEIFDLTAVRVISESVRDCYNILGLVHDAWKPLPDRFHDYIAMPKSNGYQSLHTTVCGRSGRPVEIQIRTREMHKTAEYGVAAHWRYKEGATDKLLDQKMSWFRQMLEWQSELKDAKDFMEGLKIDLASEEVFVFTPKGDVFALLAGATPVDFAYRVHSEIGHRCVGAKANGKIIPLDQPLKNGDIVEIITGKKDNPSRDWLSFVKTTSARVKIKNWIRKQFGEDKIEVVAPALAKEAVAVKPLLAKRPRVRGKGAIKVTGLDNVLVRFSRCCQPLPGEEIIGFVSHGRGIAIHQRNCPNVVRQEIPPGKRVAVEWNLATNQIFPVEVEIEAFDRVGVLKDILAQISELEVNVSAARVSTKRGSSAFLRLAVDVRNSEHLSQILAAIRLVPDVYEVNKR